MLGLLATAAVPAAVYYADRSARVELIWAGVAVPVGLALGIGAVLAARAGRRRAEPTLRRSGLATSRMGRLLGVLGLLLGGTGVISLLVYAILTYRGRA